MTAKTNWPSTCPDEFCDDIFPSSPSKRLVAAYRAYLAQKSGVNTLLVCTQIQNDHKIPDLLQIALENKWPTDINFDCVTNRIEKRRDEISGLLTNEIVISVSAAWKTFIQMLSSHSIPLVKFNGLGAQAKFTIVGPVTHCG